LVSTSPGAMVVLGYRQEILWNADTLKSTAARSWYFEEMWSLFVMSRYGNAMG
jgi:hypothetical protein